MPGEPGGSRATSTRRVGRADREQDLAAAAELCDVAGVLQPARVRARGRRRAPAGGGPEHGLPALAQHRRDRRSHLAGMQETDDRHDPIRSSAFAAILRSPP